MTALEGSSLKDPWGALARGLRMLGAIIVVGLLVALAVAAAFPWSVERHMSVYGTDWNDASFFRRELTKRGYSSEDVMSSPRVLEQETDWSDHLLVILGVERPYTKEEVSAIGRFLDRGGNLLLADDGGYSEPLFREFAEDADLNRSRLYSPDSVKNPDFIRASGYIDSGPIADRSYTVLTDRPAAFVGAIPGSPFLYTSNGSWIDANGNKEKDLEEESRAYCLGFFYSGNTFLSDPSIFINDMTLRYQNMALVVDIVTAMLPKGGKVIFDESRHISKDAGQRAQKIVYDAFMFVAYDLGAKLVLVAVCIVAVLVFLRFVKLPTDWFHLPNLDEPWLLNYREGGLNRSDAFRLRVLLENKVRVFRRLSSGEFKLHRQEIMEQTVKDVYLMRFYRSWELFKKEDLERIINSIKELQLEPADGPGGDPRC